MLFPQLFSGLLDISPENKLTWWKAMISFMCPAAAGGHFVKEYVSTPSNNSMGLAMVHVESEKGHFDS